ncbi:MAG: hypothetical protein WBV85_07625 [Solirubrobacteraceae bacterium]
MKLSAYSLARTVLSIAMLTAGLVLASSTTALAGAGCPNEQFRRGLGANLPDCRAYEQVSPKEKNGGGVDDGLTYETEPAPEFASPDGESAVFASQTPFPPANPLTAPTSSQYMARRSPSGWRTIALDPRQDFPEGKLAEVEGSLSEKLYQGFSEDLRYGYLDAIDPPLVPQAPEGHYNPYIRNTETGTYTLLAGLGPSEPPEGFGQGVKAMYAGMSSDGRHAVFAANAALTPGAVANKTNLYEWNEGALELVSILPNGEADTHGTLRPENSNLRFGAKVEEGGENGVHWDLANVLSSDGKKAFWRGGNGRLYMHELTGTGARTVEVSASQKTGAAPETGAYAHYWTASKDGSLIYFSTCEQLTNDSTAVEGECYGRGEGFLYPTGAYGQDLYQYNTLTGKLTDITVDPNAGETANVQGVIGASDDGSYVYFVATGVLASGATEGVYQNEEYTYTHYNVYVWHDGVTRLVTALDSKYGKTEEETRIWDQGVKRKASRVSANGRFLAFDSANVLTGYSNVPTNSSECDRPGTLDAESRVEEMSENGKRCLEVYLYDAQAESLVCASCSQDGLPPTGNSIVPDMSAGGVEDNSGWETPTEQQHYLLDDGRLFFDSTGALVSADTNGTGDVYEYELPGTGSCTGAKACLRLISGGIGSVQSRFVDSDGNGDNLFFVTYDRLVEGDGDESEDLYDARVDGGFEAGAGPPCSGEACKPAISVAPSIYGAPTSEAFSGAGNQVPVTAPVRTVKAKKPVKHVRKKKKPKHGKAAKSRVQRGSGARRGKGRGK